MPFRSVPRSPIVVVPSPPGFSPGLGSGSGSGGGGGPFQPPIVYPPPMAPPKPPGAGQTLWCVAKPTVSDPSACATVPTPCSRLAHASFAFNHYWQQAKAAGGTATIVTRDPSYGKCKFDLL